MNHILKHKKEIITGTVLAILLFFFLKYLFPLVSPFLFSFITIYSIYPFLYKMEQRFHIHKTVTACMVLIVIFLILALLVWSIGYFAGGNLASLISCTDQWRDQAQDVVHTAAGFLQEHMGVNGKSMEAYLIRNMDEGISSLQDNVFPGVMKNSVTCVKKILPVLAFTGIYIISTVLFSKDFDSMMEQVHKVGALDAFMTVMEGLLHTIGTYLKAQGIIILVITLICCTGMKLADLPFPFLLGILAGIFDLLPFIGTGLVLIPSALIQLLNGSIWKAAVCVILYILCAGAREFLEPKLMGKKLGIYPVVLLFSIYAGVKLFGVSGIIKGPFAVVLFKQILKEVMHHENEAKTE